MSNFNGILPRNKQYLEKCDEYMEFIQRHRDRVKSAYKKYFENNLEQIFSDSDVNMSDIVIIKEELPSQIENHDMSKYSDQEFEPYRIYRYQTDEEAEIIANDTYIAELVNENYHEALSHHRKINPHHPYYYLWIDDDYYTVLDRPRESALDMPLGAIIEMICDWASFDDDFNYLKWYVTKDAEDVRIIMTENTKRMVEFITSKIMPDKYSDYRAKYKDSGIFITEE